MDSKTAVNHAWTLYHQLLDLQLHLWEVYEKDFIKITMQDPYESTQRFKHGFGFHSKKSKNESTP